MENSAVKNLPKGLALIERFLVSKVLSKRLLEFARREGLLEIINGLGVFNLDELCLILEKKLYYKLDDGKKRRMIATFLDFLSECRVVESAGRGQYSSINNEDRNGINLSLTKKDEELLEGFFMGQVNFFLRCIDEAGNFLRGGSYPFEFVKECEHLWEGFLGNYEFRVLRKLLLKLMCVEDSPDYKILDLCSGLGHGLENIFHAYPSVSVTSIDFNNAFRDAARKKVENVRAGLLSDGEMICNVEWVSDRWGGFDCHLPFNDMTFDAVNFTFSDPYIPAKLREFIYREIYRILKPGGTLGVITWGYPDRKNKVVGNPAVSRQILVHDFAESVCRGWQGFHNIQATRKMLSCIGFVRMNPFGSDTVLGSSVWITKKSIL